MRILLAFFLLISLNGYSQWKSYIIGVKGDTLNKVDKKDMKQGKWVNHVEGVREEPGYEEEGEYKNNRKEGGWRIYNLSGDLIGLENYRWGNKDGVCQYFNPSGELIREEGWRAMNPEKAYDTIEVEDIDHLDHYNTVIVKNDGVAIKHGVWKFYNPSTGMIFKTETYTLGKLETPKSSAVKDSTTTTTAKSMVKPKEVQDYEKKNAGKKKIKVRDGSVGY
jgi:antitoxin component YwqK of YwqJK toxin-antitoxin module